MGPWKSRSGRCNVWGASATDDAAGNGATDDAAGNGATDDAAGNGATAAYGNGGYDGASSRRLWVRARARATDGRRHGWRHGWPVDGDDGDLWYGCRRHGWPRNGHGVSDDGDVCADDDNDGRTNGNDGRTRNDYGRTNDNHELRTASPDGLRDGPGHVLWASSCHGYRWAWWSACCGWWLHRTHPPSPWSWSWPPWGPRWRIPWSAAACQCRCQSGG